MEMFTYQGYQGSVETSIEDGVLHGKILFINDLVTYEGTTIKKLRQEFELAVYDYLKTCKQGNIEPNKPMTGQFNVRVGELLHKQATIYSLESNTSLNNVVVEALNTFLKKSHRASVRHS